jgi:glutathione S-transferase
MMKLYSGPLSLFARKVEIALEEKGLHEAAGAYAREMVPFNQQVGYQPKHPAVLAANPKGQVPVLVVPRQDGDLALFDSTVIFEYLEDAHPLPPLLPGDAAARARCRMLELYADDVLFQKMRKLVHRSDSPPQDAEARAAQIAAGRQAEAEIAHEFAKLETQLAPAQSGGKEFFCGDLSIADIGLFMTMLFIHRLLGPKLDPYPNLAAWNARLMARPAFARAAAEIAAADRALTPALALHAQLLGR